MPPLTSLWPHFGFPLPPFAFLLPPFAFLLPPLASLGLLFGLPLLPFASLCPPFGFPFRPFALPSPPFGLLRFPFEQVWGGGAGNVRFYCFLIYFWLFFLLLLCFSYLFISKRATVVTFASEVATVARLEDGASSKHPRDASKSLDGGRGGGRLRSRHAFKSIEVEHGAPFFGGAEHAAHGRTMRGHLIRI